MLQGEIGSRLACSFQRSRPPQAAGWTQVGDAEVLYSPERCCEVDTGAGGGCIFDLPGSQNGNSFWVAERE